MNLNYIYWYEQNLNNKKAQIFYFNFIVYASTFIISYFIFFQTLQIQQMKTYKHVHLTSMSFSNYFEKGKNIQLILKTYTYFRKQKILNVLGKYFHMM